MFGGSLSFLSQELAAGQCPQQVTATRSISFLARSNLMRNNGVLCRNWRPVNVVSHKICFALPRI